PYRLSCSLSRLSTTPPPSSTLFPYTTLFRSLKNIGLIIIDEEHESSYKQDENPRYHARDVAQWRAKYHHATLVLGSATPSLKSRDRKSTRLNSSHVSISYAAFCSKKKTHTDN